MANTVKSSFGLLEIGLLLIAAVIAVSLWRERPDDTLPQVADFDLNTQYLAVDLAHPMAEAALPEAFRTAGYFGILVRDKDMRDYYRTAYNDLATAEAAAMASCHTRSLAAETCKVVGKLVPLGYAATQGTTLTAEAALALRQLKSEVGQKAMAVSGDGTFGMGWAYQTRAEAVERAFRECRTRQAAFSASTYEAKIAPCTLIYKGF